MSDLELEEIQETTPGICGDIYVGNIHIQSEGVYDKPWIYKNSKEGLALQPVMLKKLEKLLHNFFEEFY